MRIAIALTGLVNMGLAVWMLAIGKNDVAIVFSLWAILAHLLSISP